MSDLISREAVLEFEEYVGEPATWDKPYPKGDLYVKSEIIERIPSVEPERRWIPISEKLPDKEGWYLVTDDSGGVLWLEVEHYDPESGLKPFCTIQNPIAWMPLPEPYKDGDQDG